MNQTSKGLAIQKVTQMVISLLLNIIPDDNVSWHIKKLCEETVSTDVLQGMDSKY